VSERGEARGGERLGPIVLSGDIRPRTVIRVRTSLQAGSWGGGATHSLDASELGPLTPINKNGWRAQRRRSSAGSAASGEAPVSARASECPTDPELRAPSQLRDLRHDADGGVLSYQLTAYTRLRRPKESRKQPRSLRLCMNSKSPPPEN
jgi:hypothetical protein